MHISNTQNSTNPIHKIYNIQYTTILEAVESRVNMFKTTDYLRKSPDGWYSYRRRVPSKLVELFPFKEFQKAYNTKNKARAFTQHAAYHKEVERQIRG